MRSRTAGVMTTLMRNGRDRRSGKPVKGHARLESAFGWDPISGSHQGQRPQWLHRNGGQSSIRKQAGYMAAPERFAKRQIPLAPRAPSIHGPYRRFAAMEQTSAIGGHSGLWQAVRPTFTGFGGDEWLGVGAADFGAGPSLVVNIRLMRAPEALCWCCQAAI